MADNAGNDAFDLMRRNAVEVVDEAELREHAKRCGSDERPVVYCGYETSGDVHLGHLVTITKLLDFQKAGAKVKVLFADWHTWLNQKGDWDFIKKQVSEWEKIFRAAGLVDAEYVLGSSFQRSIEYVDDVLKLSLRTTLNRALRSMQEVGRDMEHAKVSQMIYPLMQIADIKWLGVDIAYGGIEQRKIHMLARELLPGLEYKAPTCVHTPLIPSLTSKGKMSSSVSESLISLKDDEASVAKKLRKAYCPEGVVEENPVLAIAKLVVFPRVTEFVVERPEKFGGNVAFSSYDELERTFVARELHPMDLKDAVAKHLSKILGEIQAKL
ncbi:tyrosine--tRNA ligase [Candidatus Woesearchaeota archaeon]|nr:MAG: tyrosine--tRNA ligase [Candidatus Woesearchaeota archaeon]